MCGLILECEMYMGFVNKIFGEKRPGDVGGYIDLEKYVETTQANPPAKMHVRVGEIHRYEDLKNFTDYVYGGNVLLLDFSQIAEEEVILKRVTNDLKEMCKEINGDIAGIGNNLMIVSPSDVKIDRRKLRGTYS
jgi:filamentous hemagglutinin family protein